MPSHRHPSSTRGLSARFAVFGLATGVRTRRTRPCGPGAYRRYALSALLGALACAPAAAEAADVYLPTELTFAGGTHANPYTDVTMYADFTGPNGESVRVDAFWDGDTTWRIRFAPSAAGDWSYVTTAVGDPSLDGQGDTLVAAETTEPGFVVPDADYPHSFRRSRGEPVFLLGDTNWRAMSTVVTDGAPKFPLTIFQEYVDARVAQGFNFVRSYIVPIDAEGWSTNANEGGYAFEPWDPDELNPAYFAAADVRIEYAVTHGLTPALLFGADNRNLTDFFGWDDGKLERYVRYCVARYGAYDVTWEGRAEIEDQGTSPEPSAVTLGNQLGNWTMDADGHGHARSIHTTDSNNEFGDESWLDWLMHQGQPANQSNYSWSWITADRRFGKPVMNEEFYYENSGAGATHDHHLDANTVRKGAWHVATAGAGGLAYGNTGTYNSRSQPFIGIEYVTSDGATYMTHLASFWRGTRFSRLSPPLPIDPALPIEASDLVRAPGEEYVAYFETGGNRSIWIEAGEYSSSWYNPRTGQTEGTPAALSSTGKSISFSAPDSEDWVLHVVRDIEAPTAATALGPVLPVGLGADPDVVVSADGTVHVVYVRETTTYYVKGTLDGVFEPEIAIGPGVDPRIALGPDGDPHVVVGANYGGGSTVSYARWESTGFSALETVTSTGQNRKPRIEVDAESNAIVSFEDRSFDESLGVRVRYVRIAPEGTVSELTIVGADNNGGLGIDAAGLYHFTFRANGDVQHTTSTGPGNVGTAESVISGTSDFSELVISPTDGSLHVVAEMAGGGGVYYTTLANGAWSTPQLFAEAQVVGVDDPDHVNPAVAADELGRTFVTFAGIGRVPYYVVIDEAGTPGEVLLLAPGGGITGGKYENPNLEEVPGGGAIAAWGSADHVYLRTMGVPVPDEPGGSGGAGGGGGAGAAGAGDPVGGAGADPMDGGAVDPGDDGGCGCIVGSRGNSSPSWLGLVLVGLPLLRRRRSGAPLRPDLRACTRDDECVVAGSLAGLDHLPRPGDTCEGTCYVGVRREHLALWNAAVKELAASVPCDKEFEECPPITAYTASCSLGKCGVKYRP